ncbi:MAG: YajQ family cyclic di-GMP-binding protein [Vicinamibacteria bacterium]
MAAESSFDIVCKVDLQEVRNAIGHAMKEIENRFDLKGSGTEIELIENGAAIELRSSEELKLQNGKEVLETKLVKRGVPLKALESGKIESALGGTVRQRVDLQAGIPMEKAREIVKMVKTAKLKVQAAIQGDQVRISGKNKDDLQSVITLLKESDLGIAMQFTNYR